ncbi:MAG: peptide chain release factor 1 [Christensenellaceae bacterium]|nr:peptide chain release factor 1 [Christensenellaceae bacterium]
MFDKLDALKKRYEELSQRIADSEVIANRELFKSLVKEHSELEEIVAKYDEYNASKEELSETREMAKSADAELMELIKEEISELEAKIAEDEETLKIMLVPKDPNDEKNVILEIRAGTGGDEAALFGMDLLRMYTRYAERHRLKTETLMSSYTEKGGVKEISVLISGKGAYSQLKYESGVHRVQRVPETESQGRIHTSAATVAVLPEAEDVDIELNIQDIRVDVYRASGNGGQCVNTTDSAVRLTHIPTGVVVTCQDEKSQLKNKEKAMKVLKSRLYDMAKQEQERERAGERKNQVGSGDRSERIRTYNFPQGRVTDHRIGLTLYKLEAFIDGDLDEIIEALTIADRVAKMEN